jgi:ubiquitin-conjugating enzyme E2 variant
MEILSQEFHKWSHMMQSDLNPIATSLQKAGLTIGRIPHAQHHVAPFKGNYCIVSGFCNKALDNSGFFRKLERVIYSINGVESNSWKIDPKLKAKTLSGDYSIKRY